MPTKEAPEHLWREAADLDRNVSEYAIEEIVIHYQYLVEAISRKLERGLPSYIEDEELLSLAQVGLMKAIHRYDPSRGPFSKYASTVIWGSIIDGLRAMDFAPTGLRKQQRELEAAIKELQDQYGEDPTVAELSEHMDLPEEEVRDLQHRINRATVALYDPSLVPQSVHAENNSMDMWSREMCREFVTWLKKWDMNTQEIILLKYWKNLPLRSISQETNLPMAYVRERHHAVLTELLPFMLSLTDR